MTLATPSSANDAAAVQAAFRALADPTRRDIIELLSEDEKSVADVANQFTITRAAVKKHLVILEEGRIVTTQRRGRETFNRLEPLALKQAADWLGRFEAFWDERLSALKTAIEHHENQGDGS